MNDKQISKISIEGYKSINKCEIELKMLNVLIGSNGSGKSNFISLFKLLDNMIAEKLQLYVTLNGGADSFLFFGSKNTEKMKVKFRFGNNGYDFELVPAQGDHLVFANEAFYWNMNGTWSLGSGHLESKWRYGTNTGIDSFVQSILKEQRWKVYHFHDTSDNASVKKYHSLSDNLQLADDARNLGAFLYRLRETEEGKYQYIVDIIRLAAPYFHDFVLEPDPINPDSILLRWNDIHSDVPFSVAQMSDGTLRFICLTVLLMQPAELQPETILIDEPELGLHPYAIKLLADMLKKASQKKQIIISTQSVELLNEFSVDNVIVVDHIDNHTEFERLSEEQLKIWLDSDYSLGQMWGENVFGGRPR